VTEFVEPIYGHASTAYNKIGMHLLRSKLKRIATLVFQRRRNVITLMNEMDAWAGLGICIIGAWEGQTRGS